MTNAKTLRWLLFLLFALAVGSTVGFVFLPRQKALAELRDELRARQQYIQQSEHLDVSIVRMENDLNATGDYVDNRTSRAPAGGDLDLVFGSIAAEAKSSGVVTHRFQPLEDDQSDSVVKRMTATLVTEGDFRQLFDFLRRLEQMPLAFWIDQLHLQLAGDETDRLNCEMTLVIFADNRGNSN